MVDTVWFFTSSLQLAFKNAATESSNWNKFASCDHYIPGFNFSKDIFSLQFNVELDLLVLFCSKDKSTAVCMFDPYTPNVTASVSVNISVNIHVVISPYVLTADQLYYVPFDSANFPLVHVDLTTGTSSVQAQY